MIELKNIEISNVKNAIRGMRNPMDSWEFSDSKYNPFTNEFEIGEKDRLLALRLVRSGTDHSKFMRQIIFSVDINAPIYWWKEMDTYKVATVANSTSTMHKMGSRLLTLDDFSWDDPTEFEHFILANINTFIIKWQGSDKQDKKVWRRIIQNLPSSYNQMRTWTANYQTLRNIYFARRNHKLIEWHDFCKMIESLPYSELITIEK